MNLETSIQEFIHDKKEYFRLWTFEEPIQISHHQNEEIKQLQKLLYKAIVHFVTNYHRYEHLMPVSDSISKVLELYKDKPYEVGTYRTDFVFDSDQNIKIIEISCRCSLNALFMSSVFRDLALDFLDNQEPALATIDPYKEIYGHLNSYLDRYDKVYVLRGEDKRNESKIFKSIFERMGKEVVLIEIHEIESHIYEMKSSWIITELSFEEILSIPFRLIKQLVSFKVFNDLRTVFLIHDKRFFSVLNNSEFLDNALAPDEANLLKQFYLPTYSTANSDSKWDEVALKQNEWVIKPSCLGNGTDVRAGVLTESIEWQELIQSRFEKNLVAQKWVSPEIIEGSIGSKKYSDYVTGTFLFFDNHYFGLGPFRTCSSQVSNQIDCRKAFGLIVCD